MATKTKSPVSTKPTKSPPTSLRSEHKEVLVELEKYRLLVENVQDYAIFLLDTEGYIQTWNKGAQRFKGYKPNEIIGKHFSIFYQQSDIEAKKPERELVLARQMGRVEDEDWRIRKDGSRFWANVIITALYDSNGELAGFGKVTRDLSERKQQEEELRQANVALRQQQRELQHLNESKDEFISLASHQLRTPATGIKQQLGMLLEGFLGEVEPRHLEYIQKAYSSNERELGIINSLLKVARVDAGKVMLRKTPTDIGKLVTEVVGAQADSIKQRGQRVRTDISKTALIALVDRDNLYMAIENLIDNASKYTPEKGEIIVTIAPTPNDDETIEVTVHDSGVGISPDDMAKLFMKFSRIPNALSSTVGGSGLGLYWTEKIIALHGGWIDVESAVGKGAAFKLNLPVGDIDA